MTKEEILAMEAGKELDKLVHQQVFQLCVHDWKLRYSKRNDNSYYYCPKCKDKFWGLMPESTPRYSRDISVAWQVLEKIKELLSGHHFDIHFCSDGLPEFHIDGEVLVATNEVPEAISKAALIAVLETKNEK